MSYHPKEKQLSFKVEDELAKEVEAAADREDLRVADFVRKVFKYGFFKYRAAGRLWHLQAEQEQAVAERQAEIAKREAGTGKRERKVG
jgi:hypothetical protein